jgi:hypothetical protein
MSRGKKASDRVDLTRTLELLREHVSTPLCTAAFRKVRTAERERKWSLQALVQFWVAILLRAAPSLTHALAELREGHMPEAQSVESTDQAFFERCKNLSWKFFAEVFRQFVQSVLKMAKPRYRTELSGLRERFTDVLIIDGSRVAAIAHKLKILWNVRSVVLPGCLIALYDLFRGIPRVLEFCADAAASEFVRAMKVADGIKRGTLIVGDRLYCAAQFFEKLGQKGVFGVFRRNKRLGLWRTSPEPLRKKRYRGGLLTEYLVQAGSGQTAAPQRLRLIRFKQGRKVYELLTNVLDPQHLSGEEAMDLYPARWTVERMYYDLKEVVNLNRVYAGNPNAVGMQVYAGALVYTAMRVAQGEVAEKAGIEPEEISPAKFFPKMAAACAAYTCAEWGVARMLELNPSKHLRRPRWKGSRMTTIRIEEIRRRKRTGERRARRYCKARRRWKAFSHIRGGQKLTW